MIFFNKESKSKKKNGAGGGWGVVMRARGGELD